MDVQLQDRSYMSNRAGASFRRHLCDLCIAERLYTAPHWLDVGAMGKAVVVVRSCFLEFGNHGCARQDVPKAFETWIAMTHGEF